MSFEPIDTNIDDEDFEEEFSDTDDTSGASTDEREADVVSDPFAGDPSPTDDDDDDREPQQEEDLVQEFEETQQETRTEPTEPTEEEEERAREIEPGVIEEPEPTPDPEPAPEPEPTETAPEVQFATMDPTGILEVDIGIEDPGLQERQAIQRQLAERFGGTAGDFSVGFEDGLAVIESERIAAEQRERQTRAAREQAGELFGLGAGAIDVLRDQGEIIARPSEEFTGEAREALEERREFGTLDPGEADLAFRFEETAEEVRERQEALEVNEADLARRFDATQEFIRRGEQAAQSIGARTDEAEARVVPVTERLFEERQTQLENLGFGSAPEGQFNEREEELASRFEEELGFDPTPADLRFSTSEETIQRDGQTFDRLTLQAELTERGERRAESFASPLLGVSEGTVFEDPLRTGAQTEFEIRQGLAETQDYFAGEAVDAGVPEELFNLPSEEEFLGEQRGALEDIFNLDLPSEQEALTGVRTGFEDITGVEPPTLRESQREGREAISDGFEFLGDVRQFFDVDEEVEDLELTGGPPIIAPGPGGAGGAARILGSERAIAGGAALLGAAGLAEGLDRSDVELNAPEISVPEERTPFMPGEITPPAERGESLSREIEAPADPFEEAFPSEVTTPEERVPFMPGEIDAPETRPREFDADPGVIQTQELIGPLGGFEEELEREEQERRTGAGFIGGEDILGREETIVPEEERLTQISEELERRQEQVREEFDPLDPFNQPEIGTEPDRAFEDTRTRLEQAQQPDVGMVGENLFGGTDPFQLEPIPISEEEQRLEAAQELGRSPSEDIAQDTMQLGMTEGVFDFPAVGQPVAQDTMQRQLQAQQQLGLQQQTLQLDTAFPDPFVPEQGQEFGAEFQDEFVFPAPFTPAFGPVTGAGEGIEPTRGEPDDREPPLPFAFGETFENPVLTAGEALQDPFGGFLEDTTRDEDGFELLGGWL